MSDTTPEMQARYRAMVQARPPGGARFKIASDMFDITRGLLIASIRAARPNISASELRQELFLRYYGDEFTPEQRERILAAIAAYWARKEGHPPTDDSAEAAAAQPIQVGNQPSD
jgi:hypothetical protein